MIEKNYPKTEFTLMANCTTCGYECQMHELKFKPEAEASVKEFALAIFCGKGEPPHHLKEDADYDTLMCPKCYAKWLAAQK